MFKYVILNMKKNIPHKIIIPNGKINLTLFLNLYRSTSTVKAIKTAPDITTPALFPVSFENFS